MIKKNSKIILIIIIVIIFMMTACNEITYEKKDSKINLTISVAASLTNVMEDVREIYEKENSNIKITYNFGSSGSLQRQIEQGADVDIFISAATKQMDVLKNKDLIIDDTSKNFLKNNIVLITQKTNTDIKNFEDITSSKIKKIAMGEPDSVPAGQYAKEVLDSIGIFDSVKLKIVYAKDVREVLTWVETENAEVGIVYGSDLIASDKVKLVSKAPENSHEEVYYPAAVI
ncbi:MAG: molybdate ABC transporter substrate-binding protein, partial [Clostridiales bacterium]